jgi:hypothetical protein
MLKDLAVASSACMMSGGHDPSFSPSTPWSFAQNTQSAAFSASSTGPLSQPVPAR